MQASPTSSRVATATGLLLLYAVTGATQAPAPSAAPTLTVGTLTLHRCTTPGAWCGTLDRALDPSGAVAGTVGVYFEYYPHSGAGASQGTLVATEGGPGYPATESRDSYLNLYKPLQAVRDVLIMDNRGTGRSGAVDCPELQHAAALTEANVAACGRSLSGEIEFIAHRRGVVGIPGVILAGQRIGAIKHQ